MSNKTQIHKHTQLYNTKYYKHFTQQNYRSPLHITQCGIKYTDNTWSKATLGQDVGQGLR